MFTLHSEMLWNNEQIKHSTAGFTCESFVLRIQIGDDGDDDDDDDSVPDDGEQQQQQRTAIISQLAFGRTRNII